MSIFKNLFGSNGKTETHLVSQEPIISDPINNSTENWLKTNFADLEPPVAESQQQTQSSSKVSEFLNRNYESKGINDGYEFGTHELLENSIKKIKSEFLISIDQMIEDKKLSILKLSTQKLAVGTIAPTVTHQLEASIVETNNSVSELQKQKGLSSENEGWVMNAVHSYKDGFIRGLLSKTEEDDLLSPISNLFNSKN